MNNAASDFLYQVEAPSDKDIFISKGHDNTANAITNTILKHDNIHIVGLEGALGAGKSTVINIVESQLCDENYHFICFDVDQHHHGSTKASFIKVFYQELTSPRVGVKSEAVNDAKDRALGNKFTYTKDVNSKLTYYVLFFLISLAFSVKYLPEAVLHFFNTIYVAMNGGYKFSGKATVTSILGFSPLLVLIPVAIKSWCDKKRGGVSSFFSRLFPGAPTFGNLLKKNSKDTIDEIIDVTRDVTSYELREAFKVFVEAIPQDKKIVLVIDNLDRLDDSKTKEVWSDLDVFTSVCNSRCKIILPFSEYHVAKALKDDGDINTGYEYISKRLPVVFRAPPIVTSGWREQFENAYWSVTLPNINGVELCSRLIELWESNERQITPRFLKKHVNDIACIIASSPFDNISAVCCSAYLLTVKYSHIKIEEVLSFEHPDQNEDKSDKEKNKIRKLIATHKILKKEMDVKDWSIQLACIHFQTTEDIAGSELLTEPARTAMLNCDASKIIELSSLYGFSDKFSNVIEDVGFMESTKLLAAILELDDERSSEFVKKWLADISYLSKSGGFIPEFDQLYIDSLITLNNYKGDVSLGSNIDLTPLKRKIRALSHEIPKEPSGEKLTELYQYCRVEHFKPDFVRKPSADLFLNYLWPNRNVFKLWDVTGVDALGERFRPQVLSLAWQSYTEDSSVSEDVFSIFKWMASKNKLSLTPEHKSLLKHLEITHSGYPALGSWVYSIPYDNRWGSTSLVSYLLGVLSRIKSFDDEDCHAAFIAAIFASAIVSDCFNQSISYTNVANQHQTTQPIGMIKGYLDKLPSLEYYLADYLTFSSSLSFLVGKLGEKEIFDYIKGPVREIIINKRYRKVDLSYLFGDGYLLLNSVLSDVECLDFIDYLGSVKVKDFEVGDLSDVFVNDVIGNNVGGWCDEIKSKFNSEDLEAGYWESKIDNMSPSMILVLKWMIETSFTITRCSLLSDALKSVLTQKDDKFFNQYDKAKQINLLMKVLPRRSVDSVVRVYRERLLADTASLQERYAIIRNFGDFISIPIATSDDGKSRYISLIENAKESIVVSWLNSQDWSFEEWPRSLISQLSDVLKHKSEEFDVSALTKGVKDNLQTQS